MTRHKGNSSNISWFKNGEELYNNTRYSIENKPGVAHLSIADANPEIDNGQYRVEMTESETGKVIRSNVMTVFVICKD